MGTKRIRLSFFGGTGEVTGANFLLEAIDEPKPIRVLVDCGLFQGSKICDEKNRESFPYDPASIDYLVVTHAHIDHTGRIPKLVREGFRGKIISTPPTKELARVMLEDSLGVLSKEAKNEGLKLFYSLEDIEVAETFWQGLSYHEIFNFTSDFSMRFFEAGHTLGSAVVEFTLNGKKLVFSGDLGNSPAPLLRSAETINDAEYLVVESVYGDRNHEHRDLRRKRLEQVIEETMKRGGVLMIPAFSFERTQELLYEIERMMEEERIPLVPVFVDSPLAIKITDIYKKYEDYFNKEVHYIIGSGNEIFKFPQLHFTMATEESKAINEVSPPKIIMAGSGMSNGGRILHHEKLYLPDQKNTLLMVGYQAARTLGRQLQDGIKQVKIHGEEIPVRAKVETLHGYSGHLDSTGLLGYVAASADSLKKVFVTMGEQKSSLFLVQRIRDYLGIPAVAPEAGDKIELEF